MEKPYKIKKRLLKASGSQYIVIPAWWLKKQMQKLSKKVIGALDLLIYDEYIELRPTQK